MSLPANEIEEINPISLQQQLRIARNEINNLRQQLITLSNIHKKSCQLINEKLEAFECSNCKKSQIQFNSNQRTDLTIQNVPSTSANSTSIDFQSPYIGTIYTNFPEKRCTPRQPGICANLTAKIVLEGSIFSNPDHALQGLEEFSHMWILFHFHKNELNHIRAKVSPPRLNGVKTGVFATRSPHRPCPIGLSLVKIDRIEHNTIYFSGVDMVDGTPVLDIKPYIPQYDYPGIAQLNIRDNCNISSRILCDVSENEFERNHEESNHLDNMNERVMDGEENGQITHLMAPESSRSNSRMEEREAPDGEEEESPRTLPNPQNNSLDSSSENVIRVPSWIDQPAVTTLTVLFKDRALVQLGQLGSDGADKKAAITSILQEDPRSVYLRERWSSHCYVFRIAELHVSCKFNDSTHTVTVYQVFQNEVTSEEEQSSSIMGG